MLGLRESWSENQKIEKKKCIPSFREQLSLWWFDKLSTYQLVISTAARSVKDFYRNSVKKIQIDKMLSFNWQTLTKFG